MPDCPLIVRTLLPAMLAALLSACGGGCGSCSATTTSQDLSASADTPLVQLAAVNLQRAPNRQEATRFLTQATFGPTPDDVAHLMAAGYEAWLDEQFAMPMASVSHVAAWDAANKAIMAVDAGQRASSGEVTSTFWRQAIAGPDQLRQRVVFALSEIFVVSVADSCGGNAFSRGAADYLDMLGRQAFGNYRSLIESVALHPVMGCYLSHMKNLPADVSTGRVPDENFARELMQLFSIGLYELNADGSLKTDALQQPIETYGPSDIAGLAKVFTGWSWWCNTGLTPACFNSAPSVPAQYVTPMRGYGLFHDTSEKRFLNTVIPGSWFATPESSLKSALDGLSSHPNVGPFIGKQLIQRLVTSNPSPAYVARVAAAYTASQGSLKAMLKAILLDTEARSASTLQNDRFGKLREPLLKLSAVMRAVGTRSESGLYLITTTADPGQSLGQSAMASPSVFNFFRPAYMHPGSFSAQAKLATPELQIANETSAAGYVNAMTGFMWSGTGRHGFDNKAAKADVQLKANVDAADTFLGMADAPASFVEEINQRLMYGTMPQALKDDIVQAIGSIDYRAKPVATADQITATRRARLWSALLLTAVSPEFQVQR